MLIASAVFVALFILNNQQVLRLMARNPLLWTNASLLPSMAGHLRSIAFSGWLILSFIGIGTLIVRRWRLAISGLWGLCLALAIGTGLATQGLFILGLGGWWSPITLHSYAAALTILGGAGLLLQLKDKAWGKISWPRFSKSKESWALLGVVIYGLWTTLCIALSPPTEWDVITYHLVIPKLYLAHGGLFEIPWLLHSHWPHLIEILYALPLAFSMDRAAALLHWAFAVGTVASVYAAARHYLDIRTARLSFLVMMAQPLFLRYAGTAHADAAWAFFTFLSLLCAWQWSLTGATGWLPTSALLAGWAVSCKMLALLTLIPLQIWIFFQPVRLSDRLKAAGLFAGLAGALWIPWFVKTWLWTGNPVWPFASGFIPSRYGAALFEMPYRATFLESGPLYKVWWMQQGGLWLFIPCLFLAALAIWQRIPWPPILRFFGAMAILHVVVLVRHHEFWRFLWPFVPPLAMAFGWVGTRLWESARRSRVMIAGVFLIIAWPLLRATPLYAVLPVLGVRSITDPTLTPREAYLEKVLPIYAGARWVNHHLTGSDRLLLFREIRGYYFDVPYLWGDPVNQGLLVYYRMRTSDELYAAMRRLGLTHVFINSENYFYDAHTIRLMDDLVTAHGRLVYRDKSVTIFKLPAGSRKP